jgi:hypothetical protein
MGILCIAINVENEQARATVFVELAEHSSE